MQFQGDIGILTLGRKILKNNPKVELNFVINGKQNSVSGFELKLMTKGIWDILKSKTRFGRIGIMVDRKNFATIECLEAFDSKGLEYNPVDKRAEKEPKVTLFVGQCFKDLALEGCVDSVEFRRLVRKHIRRAKHANCDTLFFPEPIFGDTKTKKILQHIAGTQLKVYTLDDFFEPEIVTSDKQKITIDYKNEDPVFLKEQAERILKTKLKSDCFTKV